MENNMTFDTQLDINDIFIINEAIDLFIDFANEELDNNKNAPFTNKKNVYNNISIAKDAADCISKQNPISLPQLNIIYASLEYLREIIIHSLTQNLTASERDEGLETQKMVNGTLRKLKPIKDQFPDNFDISFTS